MAYHEEDHPEFEANYFDPESFFSLEYYREYYEKAEKEAILYFTRNKQRYNKLQKGFPKLSVSTLKTLAWKSYSDIHYEEKLTLWRKNKASPFDTEYHFKIKIKNKDKPLTIIASIHPKNELQRNLYLQFLIEYISSEYIANTELYGAEVFSYNELKEHFLKGKEKDSKKEMEAVVQKCNQIAKDCSLSVDFIDYIHYFNSYHSNLSSLKIERLEKIENLWALAIEISFYYQYAKYYLFLAEFDKSSTKDKKRYTSEEFRTFKKAEYFDDVKLLQLHRLLLEKSYISEIKYDDFKKVFSEVEISHGIYPHPKINWKLINRGMDKQGLLTLIEYVVSPDYTDENITTISRIVGSCFTFENRDISDKIDKSFGEAFKSFEKKNYKNSKKIEEILDKIL